MDLTTLLIQVGFLAILIGLFFVYRYLKKQFRHNSIEKLLNILYSNTVSITKAVRKDILRDYEETNELDIEVAKQNVMRRLEKELPGVLKEVSELLDGDVEELIKDWIKEILEDDLKK